MFRNITLNNHFQKLPNKISKRVCIVGGGPVGLTMGLLCDAMGIDFDLYETRSLGTCQTLPPAAHYINTRTMEILSEIEDINESINLNSDDINMYGTYRYTRRIGGKNYYIHKQFNRAKRLGLMDLTTQQPIHMPQNRLMSILEDQLVSKAKNNLFFETSIEKFENKEKSVIVHTSDNLSQEYDLLVACDGYHSKIRESAGLTLEGDKDMQNFLNIYFHSKKLAKQIITNKQNAMLHFIYNSDIVACLVNHSYDEGSFVLQVPINNKLEVNAELMELNNKDFILKILDPELGINEEDITIKNKGLWRLSATLAPNYFNHRIVLAGDSAHSLPPAGGLGMNTGIQDIHNLAHRLRWIDLSNFESLQQELHFYETERKSSADKNIKKSVELYNVSIDIAKDLGLDINNLRVFESIMENYGNSSLFSLGKKLGSYFLESDIISKQLTNKLHLRKQMIPMIIPDLECRINYNNNDSEFELNYIKDKTKFIQYQNSKGMLSPVGNLVIKESKDNLNNNYIEFQPRVPTEFECLSKESQCKRYIVIGNLNKNDYFVKDDFLLFNLMKDGPGEFDIIKDDWIRELIFDVDLKNEFIIVVRQDGHIEYAAKILTQGISIMNTEDQINRVN